MPSLIQSALNVHTSKFCSFSLNSDMVESAKDFSLWSLATFWKKKNRKELNLKNCLHCLECDIAFKLCGKSKSENAHSTGNTCCAVLMWHNDKEKVMLQYCILMNP